MQQKLVNKWDFNVMAINDAQDKMIIYIYNYLSMKEYEGDSVKRTLWTQQRSLHLTELYT